MTTSFIEISPGDLGDHCTGNIVLKNGQKCRLWRCSSGGRNEDLNIFIASDIMDVSVKR